ncbi:hypothetical protein D8911_09555 [Levilactobacillus brevis]|nr:hypothetical protein D8911_09555 [Levilactobacillus brevis]
MHSHTARTGRLLFAKYELERGGRRDEPKGGLVSSTLSRGPCLKVASSLTGMNRATKGTPTAELIFGELPATAVVTD